MEDEAKKPNRISDVDMWRARCIALAIELEENKLAHARGRDEAFRGELAATYGLKAGDDVNILTGEMTRRAQPDPGP